MLSRFRSHLRHNVVAYLALFFALGGTAIAAKPLITGADVQDGSLTGADVSDNSTLKGLDIDESDLGKVPSAQNADNAANADRLDGKDASELGGGTTFVRTLEVSTVYAPLITLDNGLLLEGRCEQQGFHAPRIRLSSALPDEVLPDAVVQHRVEMFGNMHRFQSTASEEDFPGSTSDEFELFGDNHGFVAVLSARDIPFSTPAGRWARIALEAASPQLGTDGGKCIFTGEITYPG